MKQGEIPHYFYAEPPPLGSFKKYIHSYFYQPKQGGIYRGVHQAKNRTSINVYLNLQE